ncbi:MAG TPA: ABC transporter substrate-binding protein [Acidimicrobiales bacterium]|nr:ABC transporter substrate-binding protein [Acidimicrobiales bacterium]
MNELDRRSFLKGLAGAGLVVVVGGCGAARRLPPTLGEAVPGADVGTDADSLPPAPRPTLRLPGGALGFPSPFAYVATLGYRQMSLIYDTLLWKDGSGKLLPWLASSYEVSDDGLVHRFELRDGIRWHDGKPLTADDVAFTFDYYAKKTLGPLVVVQPYGIAKVESLTPQRVEIHIERPDVTFAGSLAAAVPIAPRHVWSVIDDPAAAQDTKVLVGSGPYRLTSYGGDSSPMRFEANDDYFLGRPFVKQIEMTPTSDELTALLAGEVDAAESTVTGTRPLALEPFKRDPAYGIVDQPGGFTFPLYWNLGKGGALSDVRFRRACALAVDRKDVVERLTGGNGLPGNPGFLAPSNLFHVDVEQYRFDRVAANRLLDQAGYRKPGGGGVRRSAEGEELSFELLFPGMLTPLAQVLGEALEAVGVQLRLKSVELGPTLYGKKLAGDYEMALALYPGPSGPGPHADPDLLRPLFSSLVPKGLNSADGYKNAELDELAERQLATFGEEERRKMVGRMQEILAEDLPVLPLYYSTLFNVFRKGVFDQWYWTPGGFPVGANNRQLFVTGVKSGTDIRPTT